MGIVIDKILGDALFHDHNKDDDTRYLKKINDSDQMDMGVEQDSSQDGITAEYITDKLLSHNIIGSNDRDEEGAIRVVDGTFQIYANGVWNDVVINFRLREDDSGTYELEHNPIGFEYWYEVMSGNSDKIGIDGKPIVQQYTSSMGAFQPDIILDGGEFL